MNPTPDHHEPLEQFIHRTLRDQPPRRAPRSLEQRVLAALAQRAALPWWRQSFVHWPVAVRGAFLLASAALAGALVWMLGGFAAQQTAAAIAARFAWLETVRGVAGGIVNFGAIVFRSIAPAWIYGGAIALGALYAALFGLGTAAYRTLYANR